MTDRHLRLVTGQQLRDQGAADVVHADHAVHRRARKHIERALDELIQESRPFNADDVRALLPADVEPHSPNLFSALFTAYRRRGRIQQVDWCISNRPSRHAGPLRVWIGAHPLTSGDDAA
jgi:hypothetical protein